MRTLITILTCAAAATALPGRAAAQVGTNELIQALAGVAGSGVGAIALGLAGAEIIGPRGGEDPGVVGAFLGAMAGAGVGSALGVSLSGELLNGDARIGNTALGAMLGVGLFVGLAAGASLDPDNAPFWVAFATIPTAGALLGYHGFAPLRNVAVLPGPEQSAVGLRIGF